MAQSSRNNESSSSHASRLRNRLSRGGSARDVARLRRGDHPHRRISVTERYFLECFLSPPASPPSRKRAARAAKPIPIFSLDPLPPPVLAGLVPPTALPAVGRTGVAGLPQVPQLIPNFISPSRLQSPHPSPPASPAPPYQSGGRRPDGAARQCDAVQSRRIFTLGTTHPGGCCAPVNPSPFLRLPLVPACPRCGEGERDGRSVAIEPRSQCKRDGGGGRG